MIQTRAGSTTVPTMRDELLSQLNTLLRLTHTEEMVAQVRRTQAMTDAVERELARNALLCRERAVELRDLISALDGVQDVFGMAVGRLSAAAKSQLEQGTTLPEALFTDLALEHQLLDRTRYVRRLGEELHEPRVIDAMERLEAAHTANVEWLDSVLAELAAGEPAKLRPTTAQAAVASGRRIAFFGTRQAAHAINRSVAAFGQVQHRFEHRAGDVQHRLRQRAGDVQHRVAESADGAMDLLLRLGRDTSEVLIAGRDAALNRAEDVAREEGSVRVADEVHVVRESLGALRVDELPITDYDDLNAGMASARIEQLDSVDEVEVVLAYEWANKHRPSVTKAADARISELRDATS